MTSGNSEQKCTRASVWNSENCVDVSKNKFSKECTISSGLNSENYFMFQGKNWS